MCYQVPSKILDKLVASDTHMCLFHSGFILCMIDSGVSFRTF